MESEKENENQENQHGTFGRLVKAICIRSNTNNQIDDDYTEESSARFSFPLFYFLFLFKPFYIAKIDDKFSKYSGIFVTK